MMWGRTRQVGTVLALAAMAVGCRSVAPSDLATLAESPPAPYSVMVTGGAFLEKTPGDNVLDRTYGSLEEGRAPREAVGLEVLAKALRQARVFVRVDRDTRPVNGRELLADLHGPVSVGDGALRVFLEDAAQRGHDYLLVVERLEDGPVNEYGINSRWPVTAIAWLLLGIGMVIPDHTYESSAKLHVALRDVHDGQVVYESLFDGDPVDLALLDRTDIWGLVQSIIIPPFWVGSDDVRVVDQVRRSTTRRLLFLLAQDLKSAACRNDLLASAPAAMSLFDVDGRVGVRVTSVEGVSFVRLTIDGQRVRDPAFSRQLLASAKHEAGQILYESSFERPPGAKFAQLLVQTVGGRASSTTFALGELEEARD